MMQGKCKRCSATLIEKMKIDENEQKLIRDEDLPGTTARPQEELLVGLAHQHGGGSREADEADEGHEEAAVEEEGSAMTRLTDVAQEARELGIKMAKQCRGYEPDEVMSVLFNLLVKAIAVFYASPGADQVIA